MTLGFVEYSSLLWQCPISTTKPQPNKDSYLNIILVSKSPDSSPPPMCHESSMSDMILCWYMSDSLLVSVQILGFVSGRSMIRAQRELQFLDTCESNIDPMLDKSRNWVAFVYLHSLFGCCGFVGMTNKGDMSVLEVIQATCKWISLPFSSSFDTTI